MKIKFNNLCVMKLYKEGAPLSEEHWFESNDVAEVRTIATNNNIGTATIFFKGGIVSYAVPLYLFDVID